MKPTIGNRLLVLKDYSGLSLAQIARRGGYRNASSIQKLFKSDYNPKALDRAVALKLADAFEGLGDPPIERMEILALAGEGTDFEKTYSELSHYSHQARKFIPVFKTRRTGTYAVTEEGEEIPLFSRVDSNEGVYFPCPEHLQSRRLVGLYVTIGTMWPRYEENEIVFYEYRQPPSPGDDVVVTLVDQREHDGAMLIGRLYLSHDGEVQLDILSPRHRFVFDKREVISIHRIVRPSDMLPSITSVHGG